MFLKGLNKIHTHLGKIRFFLLIFVFVYFFSLSLLVHAAQTTTPSSDSTQNNPILSQLSGLNILQNVCIYPGFPDSSCDRDNSILLTVWEYLIRFVALIGGFTFIYAGYLTMMDKYEEAKKIMSGIVQGVFATLLINAAINLIVESAFPKINTSQCPPGQVVRSNIFGDYCINLNINPVIDFAIVVINNLLLPASAIIAVLFFLAGLYNLLISGGNATRVETGWKYMKNSILGLVAGLLSYTVINLVYSILLIFFK
jgi:hypothetical protein